MVPDILPSQPEICLRAKPSAWMAPEITVNDVAESNVTTYAAAYALHTYIAYRYIADNILYCKRLYITQPWRSYMTNRLSLNSMSQLAMLGSL